MGGSLGKRVLGVKKNPRARLGRLRVVLGISRWLALLASANYESKKILRRGRLAVVLGISRWVALLAKAYYGSKEPMAWSSYFHSCGRSVGGSLSKRVL